MNSKQNKAPGTNQTNNEKQNKAGSGNENRTENTGNCR